MLGERFDTLDWRLLHAIREGTQCAFLDAVMPLVTHLGDGGAIWMAAAGGCLLTKKYRRYGGILIGALTVGVLCGNVLLKPLVARPRPCWLEGTPLLIAVPRDFSCPSGHTLASVIGATVLTAANRKFGVAAIPLASAIAFSRLYLFVHFPSDIAASVLLGALIGSTCIHIGDRTLPRQKKAPCRSPVVGSDRV